MKLRTFLGVAALVAATALPAASPAQRYGRARTYGPSYYGRGPFYPSYIPGPSFQYFGSGGPYRAGGATFYFGPGGGYYGDYPSYYGLPRYSRHRDFDYGRYRYHGHRR